MAERIKKTPLEEALRSLGVASEDARKRLNRMPTSEVMERMPGAVYYNSSHPFRDALHLEGMIKGIEFALNGESSAVEYWLKRATSVEAEEMEPPANQPFTPPSKLQVIAIGLFHGLSLKDALGILRAKPVSVGE